MPGKSRVVDPVQSFIDRATAAAVAEETEPAAEEPQENRCPSGHLGELDQKFCAECGGPMGHTAVGSSLAVEREARVVPGKPKPDGLLTPEERAERQRLHLAAVAAGSRDVPLEFAEAKTQETFLIHFLEDGFGAFGVVWYRGQELELDVGSERWEEGKRWLMLTEFEQAEKWEGKIYFRQGPWPGKKYTDAAGGYQQLKTMDGSGTTSGPTLEQLQQADAMEQRRGRGVPRVPGS